MVKVFMRDIQASKFVLSCDDYKVPLRLTNRTLKAQAEWSGKTRADYLEVIKDNALTWHYKNGRV